MTIQKGLVISMIVMLLTASPAAAGGNRDKEKTWGQPFQALAAKIEQLEAQIHLLEEQVEEMGDENAELRTRLACVSDGSDAYDVYFDGCNVHVRNGVGATESINAKGNLIVGYNEETIDLPIERTGSHNLVVGRYHTYTSYAGFVAGEANTISGRSSSVSGGTRNHATGTAASVAGGQYNASESLGSSVAGGISNVALEGYASVGGGAQNTAKSYAHVSGGFRNRAEAEFSVVSGGTENRAIAEGSAILGGVGQVTTVENQTIPPLP